MVEPAAPAMTKDLDLMKLRQRSFSKAYTAFETQAASLVGLARQFKELQARWSSTEDDLRRRFREVRDREKVVEEREAEMEAVEKQVESSKYHLLFLKPLIDKHVQELDALKVMVSEKKEECDVIENRGLELREKLNVVEICVAEKAKEAEAKAVELREVEGRIEVKERELSEVVELIEEKKRECRVRDEEIETKRRCVEECEKEKEELVDHVEAMRILVREKGKECELIENRVLEAEKREFYFGRCVEERRKEFEDKQKELKKVEGRIRLKERELDGVLKSVQEQTRECDVNRKQVMALEWSIRKFEKEMELKREEWSRKLELKERELEGLFEKFELRGRQFEPIVDEIRDIDKRVDECLNECLVKERHLQSLEKSIQESERDLESVSHEVKMKERLIEEEAKQIKLKQVQFDSLEKTQQLEREKCLASLKKLLEVQEHSLDALLMSIEEVKMLLERHLQQLCGEIELKQIVFDSQQLEREVRLVLLGKSIEECKKQFSGFHNLVQEQKKHLDSLHTLHIKERQVENQGKELDLKSAHFESEVNTELLELIRCADDTIITQPTSDQHKISSDCRSFEVIPGIIQNLIENKQLMKAVTLICNFKQIDKFPLVPLLKEYVEGAKKCCTEIFSKDVSHDEKEKVVDDQIADLRAVIQCIEDHSLQSQYPPTDVMMEIKGLGELKENPNLVLSLPSNAENQEQKKGRKRGSSIATPTSHTYKLRSKT